MPLLEKVARRVIDKETFPSSRNLGTPVPVVFGRALRHKCPHISFGNEIRLAGNQEAGRDNLIVSSTAGIGINDLLVVDIGSEEEEIVRVTDVIYIQAQESHVLQLASNLTYNHNDRTSVVPLGVRQDYLLGEGTWGLSDSLQYFSEVYQVYHNGRVLPEFSCPENFPARSLPAMTTEFALDPQHRVQLADWYRNYHIQFIGEGGAVVGESDVLRYNPDTNTVQIDLPQGAANFICYKMREYKFFDGSQAKPFPGYAFIRLARKYTGEIRADVKGFDLTSPVDVMRECLVNPTWGAALEIPLVFGEGSIGAEYKFEGVVNRPTEIVNLFREFAKFRPFSVTRRPTDVFIQFATDSTAIQMPSEPDAYKSLPVLEYLNLDSRRNSVKVDCRLDHLDNETQLSLLDENIQSLGTEEEISLPFVYDVETSDRVLYRAVQYQIARTELIRFELDPRQILERLGVGSRIVIPAELDIAGSVDTEWVVDSINRKAGVSIGIVAYKYSPTLYSYPGAAVREVDNIDDSFIPEVDYSETPPEPARDLRMEFVRGDQSQFIVRYRLPARNCRGADIVIRRGDAESTRHSNLLRGVNLDSDAERGVEKRTFDKPAGTRSITVIIFSLPANENNELIGFPIQAVLGESPTADAGNDRSATVGGTITLDGSGSSDPDGDTLSYSWRQVSGTPVSIRNSNQAMALVTAPSSSGTLVFELTVSDGTFSATDSVTITVAAAPVVRRRRYVCRGVITGYRTEWTLNGSIGSQPNPVPPAGNGWSLAGTIGPTPNSQGQIGFVYSWRREVPIIEERCEWVTD